MINNDNTGNRLQHFKSSNYEIADGQPDILGWDVKDDNNQKLGTVKNLIFDQLSLKVRYMVVDTNNNDFDLSKRKVLIPIGLGELHEKGDDVILPGITAAQLSSLPDYQDAITTDDEYNIRNVFAGTAGLGVATLSSETAQEDFYKHHHFDEDNFYRRRNALTTSYTKNTSALDDSAAATPITAAASNAMNTTIPVIEENVEVRKRTVQTGSAFITSRIVEKPVTETVNLQEERVYVERSPVDRSALNTDFDTFKEAVIELTEHAEIPVVNKEARVVEEITINKEVTEHNETVRDTIRKTEVEIEDLKSTTNNTSSYLHDDSSSV